MNPYSEAQWQRDIAALYEHGAPPAPCPHCGRRGFYGARQNETRTRHYRFCKFCGFSQDVGAEPTCYRATVHGCERWRTVAGTPYIWWVAPGEQRYPCPYCGDAVTVEQALRAPPADDPAHPWWRVPQDLSHAEWVAFWEGQGYFRLFL